MKRTCRTPRSRSRSRLVVAAGLLAVPLLLAACRSTSSAADNGCKPVPRAGQDSEAVEQVPQLIGGLEGLQRHLRYPERARKAGIEGRVIVQFVVDEEGRVVDEQVVRSLSLDLDEEALRVTRRARFVPGCIDGEPVSVQISLPLTFRLR